MRTRPVDHAALQRGRESAEALLRPREPLRVRPGAARPKLVFAVGDSWFNYWPRGDILDLLEEQLGLEVERNAVAGRKLAEMLYATPPDALDGHLADGPAVSWLTQRIARLAEDRGADLLAILVSAGGNDVAGDPVVLRRVVNPAGTQPLLNPEEVATVVDGRLRSLFITLLACNTTACEKALHRRPPILLHGYAHPVADGRGVLGRPWLAPVLEGQLGYKNLADRKQIMVELIDRLNAMQMDVIKMFPEVIHVDVRGALKNDDSYRLYWQNELHPTIPNGFRAVSDCFLNKLRPLLETPADGRAPGASA